MAKRTSVASMKTSVSRMGVANSFPFRHKKNRGSSDSVATGNSLRAPRTKRLCSGLIWGFPENIIRDDISSQKLDSDLLPRCRAELPHGIFVQAKTE
jgi:hypothetical protein